MITATAIADVLGLRRKVRSLDDLTEIIVRGLPKSSLRHCIMSVLSDPREQRKAVYRIVPEATYKRRKTNLKPAESEKTERIARVIATAMHVWNDREEAKRFMLTPHRILKGKTPLEYSYTELGARRVEDLLWNIFYGLPA